jgi:hypothetical protein
VDATRELTLGHKECVTVLIGISVRGVATAGIVHVPFLNPRTVYIVDHSYQSIQSIGRSHMCW